MIAILAVAAGFGVFLLTAGYRPPALVERVGRYLRPEPATPERTPTAGERRLRRAGVDWSPTEAWIRRAAATGAGTVTGAVLAQGDLFVTGPGRSLPGLVVLGAVAGRLLLEMWISTRIQRRSRRLRFELPVVADVLALHVLTGEPVVAAIERYVAVAGGVAATELTRVLARHREGAGLPEALQEASRSTADPEAGRLYTLLGHAHVTGGRLADALAELSRDGRAALAREVTSEGGRRALASYGPVLALMVPITLLFLLYPTIVGLRSLATGP